MRKRLLIGILTVGMFIQSLSVPVVAAPVAGANAEASEGIVIEAQEMQSDEVPEGQQGADLKEQEGGRTGDQQDKPPGENTDDMGTGDTDPETSTDSQPGEEKPGEKPEGQPGEEKPGEMPEGQLGGEESGETPEEDLSDDMPEEQPEEDSEVLPEEEAELLQSAEIAAVTALSADALNLANFTAEYTALDGAKLSSVANGRPKLLIFYSNTCWNSRNTIMDISAEIEAFAQVDVYAIETNGGTKEAVTDFKKTYGCDDIVFSYDINGKNQSSMWDYAHAVGYSGSITWPVICYIDADNRFQYLTTGYISAEEVLNNLRKYCDYQYLAPETYSITYVLYGGTNDRSNPSAYTSDTDTITLRDAVKEGYRFEGWYRDIRYSTRVTQIPKGSIGNITLYAKWTSESGLNLPAVDIAPSDGNVVMGFSGSYFTEGADKILTRLNEIRWEACEEGVKNPNTKQPLTVKDYVPLKWSSDLEAIARLRAAEATVSQAHTRPNGKDCFSITTSNNEQSWGENLAWNWSGLMEGIEQWYGEKNDWVKNTGKEAGHYKSIINPDFSFTAVGAFRLASGGWYSVAQEFGYMGSMDGQKNPDQGECIQYIEVQGSKVSAITFDNNQAVAVVGEDDYQLPLNVTVKYADYYGKSQSYSGPYQAGGKWTSSDNKVLAVDSMGFITAIEKGIATVSVTMGSKTATKVIFVSDEEGDPIVIKPPTITTYKVGQKINLKGGKVTYLSGNSTKTSEIQSKMISGFDSTKPGVCRVTVTCGGYMSSFDTLIVEEPKLTALHGQKLADIAFPSNDYGAYTWQDSAQMLDIVGAQTFAAVFTPYDESAFQKLTDLKIQVTVQAGLDESTVVAFKSNTFTYNGTEQEPKVVVSVPVSDKILTEDKDYILSYQNNKNVGDAIVTIEGINNYFGSVNRTFKIDPAKITITAKDKEILIGDPIPKETEYEYKIDGLMPDDELITKPSISCSIVSTEKTAQYDIIPRDADAGSNYVISYVNGRLTVAEEYVSYTVTFDVQGHGTDPEKVIGVKSGDTINRPAPDPEQLGYRFDSWYKDAACTKLWNFDTDIVQSDITLYAKWLDVSETSGFALQEIADVYYTGKACKPAVSVYDGGILLKAGKDYQLKYYNNTNANKDDVQKAGNGTGEGVFNPELPYVEITGKGNYSEKVKVNFNILKAPIGDSSENPASGVKLKVSDQLVTSKKALKPFSSIKYVKAMKQGRDFTLRLTAVNARDESGRSIASGTELLNAAIPARYEGEFLLTVQGTGNYEGSICKAIHVADKSHLIKNAKITLGKKLKNIEYKGERVTLTPSEVNSADTFTVKCGSTFLRYNKDYTVSYRNNDRVGKAELIITGMGEYAGSKTVTFKLTGKPFNTKNIVIKAYNAENPDEEGCFRTFMTYTGKALTQNKVTLTPKAASDNIKEFAYGTHYTTSYKNNIKKGTATITFTAKPESGYTGSFKKTFKIMPQDISQVKQAKGMENITAGYTKAGVKPVDQIVLTNNEGLTLINGKDYTLKYVNNKAVASATVEKPPTIIIKGKGNYKGELTVNFTITEGALDWESEESSITVKTSPVVYQPNKAADYPYTPSVKLMDGKTALRAGTDYEITYEMNTQEDFENYIKNLAEGTVMNDAADIPKAVISGKAGSNYELSRPKTIPLPIYQTKLTKTNLRVEIEEAVYTGSQVTPKVKVYYRGESGDVLLEEGKHYLSPVYGANIKSGKNKGSVTISGNAPYYGGSMTVKFEIVRKQISY